MEDFLIQYGKAAKTALGFFWKAGWAFVLGYSISAMIQAFVPKARLTDKMGKGGIKDVSLATIFGAISSSCSFAALAAARALVLKGAHFIAAIAFMFASTNLVIELGILIFIFLGWQFVAAEIVGGLLLITISFVLVKLTYPKSWLEAAREKVKEETPAQEEDFDWRSRITSFEGWALVGRAFVMEWKMVWREILVGFTVAGFMAVFVPESLWQAIFLADQAAVDPNKIWIVLQNALIAPFVAAATFIGSMGNIPLATVLNAGGVAFAGLMGFIYSDLMVPPLVKVNARYYGWKVALYIAAIMYISIVATAMILHYGFLFFDILPESQKAVEEVTQFKIDYTFYMNIAAILLAGTMLWLWRRSSAEGEMEETGGEGIELQTFVAGVFSLILVGGLVCFAWFHLA